MEITIDSGTIRLGQLLKYAGLVSDGGEAKALIADGAVRVDGERETRRGRQVAVGSVVTVETAAGRQQITIVAETPPDA